MNIQKQLRNQEGFTLVEIIAVLIILGILAAVAVPRYIDLEANAKLRAIDAAVSELNGRESLQWANLKISQEGYPGDAVLLAGLNLAQTGALGDDYKFNSVSVDGGGLSFKGGPFIALSRSPSTTNQPARWKKPTP